MLKRLPLYQLHKKLGARFTGFAGFEMPLQFTSIKEEHLTVRKTVGLFDVSHMSNVWVTGREAEKLLSLTTIEDASRIKEGHSQYTAILREDGTIIDDVIFLHIDKNRYMVIPNAGMDEIVTSWLNEKVEEYNIDAEASNVSKDFVILAIQGPKSRDTLQKITDVDLNTVGFFACRYAKVAGEKCILSHTGYTGELGFELQVTPTDIAEHIFIDILDAGEEYNIKPIGLGARDTLRLEKCFLLAGNEFEGGHTPLEAMLSWAINWEHDFIGKDALIKQKEQGDYPRLTCLECIDKGIPRHGFRVEEDGKEIGFVSSGTMSPCLDRGIAMAYLKPGYQKEGLEVDIMIRDKPVKAKVVKPPFVKQDWLKTHKS